MPDALMPRTALLVSQWLTSQEAVSAIIGHRASYKLGPLYPAIRITDLGPIERGPEEALKRIQIECWAQDYDTAERLAATVESLVDTSHGEWPAGYCAGGSVESGPFPGPDEESGRWRWQLDLGLWLYPSQT